MQIVYLFYFLFFSLSALSAEPVANSEAINDANEIRAARIEEFLQNKILESSNLRLDINFENETTIQNCRHVTGLSTRFPKKKIALTFDDGPDPIGTPHVLAVLKKYGIKASFFMKGKMAVENTDIVKMVNSDDHLIIGNHTWNHRNFHKISVSEQAKEILSTHNFLSNFQKPEYFRFPFGNASCESQQLLHQLNYKIVGWHVDSCDWAFNETGSVSQIDANICGVKSQNLDNYVNHVLEQVNRKKGGIILMHDVQTNSALKLETIIETLILQGYEFVRIDDPSFSSSMR